MAGWIETILTIGTLLGSGMGGIVVVLLRAAVRELVSLNLSIRKMQADMAALNTIVATHGKTLDEHAELHRRHIANFGRLGIHSYGPGSPPGATEGGA